MGAAAALATVLRQAYGPFIQATGTGDPLASRFDAEPDFTTLTWWLRWRRGIVPRVSLSLESTGQLSTSPLLIGESFALGGTGFLRGYDFAQAVGDEGAAGLAELRYDWPKAFGAVRHVQLYAFADGGTVSNLAQGLGGGTLAFSGSANYLGSTTVSAGQLLLGGSSTLPVSGSDSR